MILQFRILITTMVAILQPLFEKFPQSDRRPNLKGL